MPTTNGHSRNLQHEVGKREPFALLEQEAYLNLARTYSVLGGQLATLFKEHGVSDPQYNALRIIAGAGRDGIRSEEIGDRMVAQDPDTTRLIDRLMKAGFVDRDRDPADRRCVLVKVTAKGRRLLDRLHGKVIAVHEAQFASLSRRDLKQLNDLLFRARQP